MPRVRLNEGISESRTQHQHSHRHNLAQGHILKFQHPKPPYAKKNGETKEDINSWKYVEKF